MIRSPAVANQFYPGNPVTLSETLDSLIPSVPESKKQTALAVVSPHAGYIYSGAVAGETFAKVHLPKDVIILGPNHHGYGAMVGLMAEGAWQMPLGDVAINSELAGIVQRHSDLVETDEVAHRFEHSLEVQVPFLQYLRKDLTITPLVISHISLENCEKLGRQRYR